MFLTKKHKQMHSVNLYRVVMYVSQAALAAQQAGTAAGAEYVDDPIGKINTWALNNNDTTQAKISHPKQKDHYPAFPISFLSEP